MISLTLAHEPEKWNCLRFQLGGQGDLRACSQAQRVSWQLGERLRKEEQTPSA